MTNIQYPMPIVVFICFLRKTLGTQRFQRALGKGLIEKK